MGKPRDANILTKLAQSTRGNSALIEQALEEISDNSAMIERNSYSIAEMQKKLDKMALTKQLLEFKLEKPADMLECFPGNVCMRMPDEKLQGFLGMSEGRSGYDDKYVYAYFEEGDQKGYWVSANLAKQVKELLELEPVREYLDGLEKMIGQMTRIAPDWELDREMDDRWIYKIPGWQTDAKLALFQCETEEGKTDYKILLIVKPEDIDDEYEILKEPDDARIATITISD